MSLLDFTTGGKSGEALAAAKNALEQLASTQTPTIQSLTLPELEKYAVAAGMTPAQMQAFLQQNNAYNDQNIDQTGTSAQIQALNQLSEVAGAGAEGSPTQRAQEEKINQDAARNLAGQRGAIDQQAQARGVPVGLLQAALQSQRAGEGQQDAHMAALQAQGQNYQQALAAMAQGGALGGQLQGQQNTQANTVAAAQNAMQQFNAANQQNASATNAGFQQQANAQNTQNANQTGAANTGLANQRTQYNAQLPQQVFQNQMQKNTGVANQQNNVSNLQQQQGQQTAGLYSGLLGTAGTVLGGIYGGPAGAAAGNAAGKAAAESTIKKDNGYATGGVVNDPDEMIRAMQIMQSGKHGNLTPVPGPDQQVDIYKGQDGRKHAGMSQIANGGGMCMQEGGMIPGEPQVPGDSAQNDTVPITVSPGEAVIPRSVVQENPDQVMGLLNQGSNVDPQDVKTLLLALQMLRGASNVR